MNKQLLAIVFFTIFAALFVGCGGSGSGGTSDPIVALQGKVSDGPLEAVEVQLASMRKGSLSESAITSSDGSYTINVRKSVLDALSNKDLPYVYARSTAQSRVQTLGGVFKTLRAKQVQFRSFLSATNLKHLAALSKSELDNDPTKQSDNKLKRLSRGLTVSHISNARALMVEARLKALDPVRFSKPITPDNFDDEGAAKVEFEDAEVDKVNAQVETLDAAIEAGSANEISKLKLIAAATKNIVEKGKVSILATQSTSLELDDSLDILLDLADGQAQLSNEFQTELGSLVSEVNGDLSDTAVAAFFENSTAFQNTSTAAVVTSTATDLSSVIYNVGAVFPCQDQSKTKCEISATFTGETTKTLNATVSNSGSKRYVDLTDPSDQSKVIQYSVDLDSKEVYLRRVGSVSGSYSLAALKPGTSVSPFPGQTLSFSDVQFSASVLGKTTQVGVFYPVTITDGTESYTVTFGSIEASDGTDIALGVVAVSGLWGTSTHSLASGSIDGRVVPFTAGTAAEAVNLLAGETTDAINSALVIASELKDSANLATKKEGHLLYAITNLLAHLADNGSNQTSLGALLEKLNLPQAGRNVFNFIASIPKTNSGGLNVGALNGLFELQSYFVDGNNSLKVSLASSIESLDFILENTSDNDSVMSVQWNGETTVFQKKDIYAMRAGMHALAFAIHFLAAPDLDLDDTPRNQLFLSSDGQTPVATNFATVAEFLTRDNNSTSVKSVLTETKLIEAFKDSSSNFLGFRNNSSQDLSLAKSYLVKFLTDSLDFIHVIQANNGSTGSTAFYVEQSDLSDLAEQEKFLLSALNNLNQSFNSKFEVDGKTGSEWYSFGTTGSEVFEFTSSSTSRVTSGFGYNYLYNSSTGMYPVPDGFSTVFKPKREVSFTSVSLSKFLTTSLRQLLLDSGSLDASQVSSYKDFEVHHSGTALSSTLKQLFPGSTLNNGEVEVPMVEVAVGAGSVVTGSLSLAWNSVPALAEATTWDSTKFRLIMKSSVDGLHLLETPDTPTGVVSYQLNALSGSLAGNVVVLVKDSTDSATVKYYYCGGSVQFQPVTLFCASATSTLTEINQFE